MLDQLKKTPVMFGLGSGVLALYLFAEFSGIAFGGSTKSQRIDPNQIRSSSPGSWAYVYWAHGSRGK